MASQPQNPEFRIHTENFHPCESMMHLFTLFYESRLMQVSFLYIFYFKDNYEI